VFDSALHIMSASKSRAVDISKEEAWSFFDMHVNPHAPPKTLFAYSKGTPDKWKSRPDWAGIKKNSQTLGNMFDITSGRQLKHKQFVAQSITHLAKFNWASADAEAAVYRLRAMMAQLRDWKRADKPAPNQYKALNGLLNMVCSDDHDDHELGTAPDTAPDIEEVPLPVKVVECHDISTGSEQPDASDDDSIDIGMLEKQMFSTPAAKKSAVSTPTDQSPIIKQGLRRIRIKSAHSEFRVVDMVVGDELAALMAKASALGSLKPGTKVKEGTTGKRGRPKNSKSTKVKSENKKGKNKTGTFGKAVKAKAKAAAAQTQASPSASVHTESDVFQSASDIDLALIKSYTPMNVESRSKMKKCYHSKIWHAERNRCIKIGMSATDRKTRASRVASIAVQKWVKFHIDGEDFD
jgi:hypothetical protein